MLDQTCLDKQPSSDNISTEEGGVSDDGTNDAAGKQHDAGPQVGTVLKMAAKPWDLAICSGEPQLEPTFTTSKRSSLIHARSPRN